MNGASRGNYCETCLNIPQKTHMSGFSKKNPLIRRVLFQNVSSNVLLIKEIFDEVAVGSRFVLFEVKILILLQEQLKIPVTASDDQICFLFIVNIEKIKIIPPPTTFPPIHRPPTQRLTESLIIFERLHNRNILILQNTDTAGQYITILRRIIQNVYWFP